MMQATCEMTDVDPLAMMAFGKVQGLSRYRKDVPLVACCAAGLIAVMAEDCGPCTQLVIDMARREGVDPAILGAVVARDYVAMPEEVALAARFTEGPYTTLLKPTICARRFCAAGACAA